jgi:hypothetical protein
MMSIETNVTAWKVANELVNMGHELAKESGLDAAGVRLFWLRVAEVANVITGDELVTPSRPPMECDGLPAAPSDDEPFPFGKHSGERYGDVPDGYYGWLAKQPWIEEWPEVLAYIQENELD